MINNGETCLFVYGIITAATIAANSKPIKVTLTVSMWLRRIPMAAIANTTELVTIVRGINGRKSLKVKFISVLAHDCYQVF